MHAHYVLREGLDMYVHLTWFRMHYIPCPLLVGTTVYSAIFHGRGIRNRKTS